MSLLTLINNQVTSTTIASEITHCLPLPLSLSVHDTHGKMG
jgi:hypothetical protein